jgi:hypothetical protein
MTSRIKFVVVDGMQQIPVPSLDMDIIDEDDELEKHILIGLGVELEGKPYKVINQVVDVNSTQRDIVYYVEAIGVPC